MKDLVSNSMGVSLIVHSRAVEKISGMMADRLGLNDKIRLAVCKAGLLHDIGKVYSVFQDYISKSIVSDEFLANNILHNEISWAVLRSLLSIDNGHNFSILYSIYWHHSKDVSGKNKEYMSSILDNISYSDKTRILNFYNLLTGENKTLIDLDVDILNDKVPEYYLNKRDKLSEQNMVILSCLVSADRLVSSCDQNRVLVDDVYCNELLDKLDFSKEKVFSTPANYDLDRFNYQLECVKDVVNYKTSILKGPAGFGKTLTGLLSWINSGSKKLIWVCPRNQVAESLYKSVLEELYALGIFDLSVQLFLTGKVKKSHNCGIGDDFSSDIVITNIDNFETPTINNYVRNRMYSILSNYVIFDEFHELVSGDPYFACFINIMKARHKLTNSYTLLMSATPSLMSHLWDTPNNPTAILPSENTHYNASHSKKYKVNLISGINNVTPKKNHLLITNSISSSQKEMIDKDYSLLIHSKFTDDDRYEITKKIYDLYGKNKPIELKEDMISAPLIQAAMDISFGGMTEILKSADDTFQRLGRLGRWGEYECVDFNIIIDVKNVNIKKREDSAIRLTYNENLSKLWLNFLIDNIDKDKEYTLNELYTDIYNAFHKKYRGEIEMHNNTMYKESIANLSKIYPSKVLSIKDNDKPNLNGSKLRDNGSNKIFCIYPVSDSDKFSEPFNIDVDSSDMDKNEDNRTQSNQLKAIKGLLGDDRFDYNSYSLYKNGNKFTSRKLLLGAKNPMTPYICFHKTYHHKYGLIENKLLPF